MIYIIILTQYGSAFEKWQTICQLNPAHKLTRTEMF